MPMAARTAVATIAGLVVVALVGALALWGLAPAPAAAADDGVSAVNGDRSSNGLGAVTDSGGLDGLAERHSQQMADRATLFHSADLGSAVSKAGIDWKRVGENVGVGGSFSEVESMFMGSAQHRGNILGDYALAGVGATTGGDGRVWVTEEFAATGAGAGPAGASGTRSSSSSSSSSSSTLLPLDGGATRDYVRAWGRPS